MTLLGAPVIESQAMEETLKEKIRLLENAISRLQELNSHDGLTILRNSLGIPKMQYILRTSNCAGRPELKEFDKKTKIRTSRHSERGIDRQSVVSGIPAGEKRRPWIP